MSAKVQKLAAPQLAALGAPTRGGAQQIEDWLRGLLRGGSLRLEDGLVELRGATPVVTTLGDLKLACGVAAETVKQGLRALEMDHWIALVDGAHTRLLGPPRFHVSVTKENLWGSVGRAIELAVAEGLHPLESIDYDQFLRRENVTDSKQTLIAGTVSLEWTAQVRWSNGQPGALPPDEVFTLAAGSQVREESGQAGALQGDLPVSLVAGGELRLAEAGGLLLDTGGTLPLPGRSRLRLERSSVIRRRDGRTGILAINSHASLAGGETVEWGDDSQWLSRFASDARPVLLRRTIFATLRDVVSEACARPKGQPADEWRVALGVHDCFLDGGIPFHAKKCSRSKSPQVLVNFLRSLRPTDSLRERLAEEYGFTVGAADARIAPTMFASAYDRRLLRSVAADPALNSEMLSLSNKLPCWAQVGAYHRPGGARPWEVTRELYFTYVDVRYRQTLLPR